MNEWNVSLRMVSLLLAVLKQLCLISSHARKLTWKNKSNDVNMDVLAHVGAVMLYSL